MAEHDACDLLPCDWQCPQAFRKRLGEQPGRQRVMADDGHMLLVLHAPPRGDSEHRDGHYFWREPSGVWHADDGHGGKAQLASLVDSYRTRLEEARRREVAAQSAQEYFEVLTLLNPLVRSVRNLHDALCNARREASEDRLLILVRDRAYALSRMADLLHQDAKHALEFAVARQAEAQADSMHRMAISAHRLNLLVGFFFPLATLAGVLSMDLDSVLGDFNRLYEPWPMLVVVAIGLSAGVFLMRQLNEPTSQRSETKS